jgi:hypothetical protein
LASSAIPLSFVEILGSDTLRSFQLSRQSPVFVALLSESEDEHQISAQAKACQTVLAALEAVDVVGLLPEVLKIFDRPGLCNALEKHLELGAIAVAEVVVVLPAFESF